MTVIDSFEASEIHGLSCGGGASCWSRNHLITGCAPVCASASTESLSGFPSRASVSRAQSVPSAVGSARRTLSTSTNSRRAVQSPRADGKTESLFAVKCKVSKDRKLAIAGGSVRREL